MGGRPEARRDQLFSAHQPATWLSVVLLVIALFSLLTNVFLSVEHPQTALIAWIGGLAIAAILLLIGLLIFPRGRVGHAARFLSALLGGFFSTTIAISTNPTGSAVLAPFTEELAKIIVVAAVLWLIRDRLRGPLDGLIVGYFTGLGFEAVEDTSYILNMNDVDGAWAQLFGRAVLGFGLHNAFAALAGVGVALAFLRAKGSWLTCTAFILTAVVLHFVWDNVTILPIGIVILSVQVTVGQAALYLFIISVFAWAVWWTQRYEHRPASSSVEKRQGPAIGESRIS